MFISLPSSFAPFIISLCLQFRASSSSYVPRRCCPALPLPCPALPCPAKPAKPAVLFFPYGVVLVCFVLFLINKKPILLHYWVLASSLYPALTSSPYESSTKFQVFWSHIIYIFKKLPLLLSKDALNWSKLTVKTDFSNDRDFFKSQWDLPEKIKDGLMDISNKCFFFLLSFSKNPETMIMNSKKKAT